MRRAFLALIPAALLGQREITPVVDGPEPLGWKAGKALNNQCPVCGTMAEPFPSDRVGCGYTTGGIPSLIHYDMGGYVGRITACEHCRAAFWQQAEV
jgi:hypothetical protein